MTETEQKRLRILATRIRIATVECIASLGQGHIGGSLSIADVLAVLYGSLMKYDKTNPKWEGRDKLVCSKGHAGPAVYATLAVEEFFPYEELYTLNRPGTNLPSHCDRNKTPGVDMTTGSLGQGTSEGVGLALADKLAGRDCRTYIIVGDGEINEGQCWEAAMFTAAKKLNNCVWLVDWNKKQLDGYTADVLDGSNPEAKFAAFGFDACTVDGNNIEALHTALTKKSDKPLAIILDTLKGRGVKQVEETANNHSMTMGPDVFQAWISELKDKLDELTAEEV